MWLRNRSFKKGNGFLHKKVTMEQGIGLSKSDMLELETPTPKEKSITCNTVEWEIFSTRKKIYRIRLPEFTITIWNPFLLYIKKRNPLLKNIHFRHSFFYTFVPFNKMIKSVKTGNILFIIEFVSKAKRISIWREYFYIQLHSFF